VDDAAPSRGGEGGGGTGTATGQEPRTYDLTIVLEPGDGGMWHAYCPTLLDYGAATWAATREEALGHIREVVGMVVMRLAEEGAPVPDAPAGDVPASGERAEVVVTVGVPIPDGTPPA
jgi:predicted RNase H-like HicB family nuclease